MNPDPAPRCRGCGGTEPELVLDLGAQPASDLFPPVESPEPQPRWPLQLWFCPDCALVQLGPMQPLLEEPVRAVESATSRAHARAAVAELMAELAGDPAAGDPVAGDSEAGGGGHRVREFASHHGGSWLAALQEHGWSPAPDGEPADLVVDTHALAHEPDVAGALNRLAGALAPDGLLVLEHHHLLPLVAGCQFDTVRHGHWSYLSLTALHRLAGGHGLEVVRATPQPVFGGSLRVTLARRGSGRPVHPGVGELLAAEQAAGLHDGSGVRAMGARARESAAALRSFLVEQRAAGRRVLGYGAPSKAAILLGVSGAGADLLEFTVDASAAKHGRQIPGAGVPIRPVADLRAARPPVVLILTWDIADEVSAQLEADGGWGADYVLPIPIPHLLEREVTR